MPGASVGVSSEPMSRRHSASAVADQQRSSRGGAQGPQVYTRWQVPWRLLADPTERQNRIDQPSRAEILGNLNPGRERMTGYGGVHPRSEKSQRRSWFGGGDVSERAPRGEYATECRIAEPHKVGEAGATVGHYSGHYIADANEGGSSFLHAGAARRRRGE